MTLLTVLIQLFLAFICYGVVITVVSWKLPEPKTTVAAITYHGIAFIAGIILMIALLEVLWY